MIKGAIFDLDGVVVDTAKYHYLAWKRLANELGFDFSEEDNERLKGVSRMASLEILLEIGKLSFDESTKLKLAARKNSWYVEYIIRMKPDEILPGVISFLEELKNNGIRNALGSASKNARTILKQIDLETYFEAVIDGNQVTKAKPNPEVFLKAAEALHIEPELCAVFEDASAGVEAAINGGMYSIGVGSPDILGNADIVIPGFSNMTYEKFAQINHS